MKSKDGHTLRRGMTVWIRFGGECPDLVKRGTWRVGKRTVEKFGTSRVRLSAGAHSGCYRLPAAPDSAEDHARGVTTT